MTVDIGDVIRLAWTNTSPAGAPVNAGSVTLTVTLPNNTPSQFGPIAPVTTGIYQYDYQTIQAGPHRVYWQGTGANPGAHSDVFNVHPAAPPYLLSLADAKEQLNKIATIDDEELRRLVESATAAVERHLDKAVVRRTVTEKRDMGNPSPSRSPDILQSFTLTTKPVISLTSVVAADGGLTWNPSNMTVTEGGVVRVLAGSVIWGPVTFTYEAGMLITPAEYSEAAGIIVQHIWQNTQRGQKGPARAGLETPGAGFTSFGYSIPYAALELLGPSLSGIA